MLSRRVVAVVVGAAFALSACAGSSSDGESATDTDDATEEVSYESPLGEFLGWDVGADFDAEAAQAEAEEQEREVQEMIATCMRAEGFEYTPVDYGQFAFFEEEGDLPEEERWGTEAWVKKYGFGITTQRFSQQQVGPDLVGYDEQMFGGPGEDFVDPNQDYVESLSQNEQDAYYAALYGDPDEYPVFEFEEEGREPTEEEMAEMDAFFESFEPSGCQNEAYDTIFGAGPGGPDDDTYMAFEEEFGDAMEDMWERIEASPELVAHREAVEACVTEKGFDYLVDEEMYMYFEDKLTEAGLGWVDPLEGVDTSDFTDEDFEAAYMNAQTQQLSAEKLAALAVLQEEEIGMALASFECGGGWEGEMEVRQELQIELERAFLEENADRLAEFEGVFAQD